MDPSQNTQTDPQPDWAQTLPREAFYEIIRGLRGALPPPDPEAPADLARRDRAAMAKAAALRPVTAAEGELAAQFVSASAWAADCLALAGQRRREIEVARKAKAQAMGMMRESKSALRMLLKLQAERHAIEADAAASERAAWAEHAALRMMEEALAPAPEAPAPEAPAPEATALEATALEAPAYEAPPLAAPEPSRDPVPSSPATVSGEGGMDFAPTPVAAGKDGLGRVLGFRLVSNTDHNAYKTRGEADARSLASSAR